MIGSCLGPYEILESLGAGGMGEVYVARDTRLGRKVAIKVLPERFASMPERLARFEQEARAAAALNHPHIAVVHDIGFEPAPAGAESRALPGDTESAGSGDPSPAGPDVADSAALRGVHYMVQEYLEGRSLREVMGDRRIPLGEVLEIAGEIAEALAAAHGAGIVHRDLKPDNVFLTGDGHAKVLDFGLAKLVEAEAPATSSGGSGETVTTPARGSASPTMLTTAAGQVMGTAGYMAPEQVNGEPIDGRADIFAFGCLLYELLAGRQPFAGRSVLHTLDSIVHDEPVPLEEMSPGLPARLHWILEKCLAKQPRGRYQHADDLAVDLRTLRGEVEAGTAMPHGAAATTADAGRRGAGRPEGLAGDGGAPVPGATRVAGVLITLAALAAGALVGSSLLAPEAEGPHPPPVHLVIELPEEMRLSYGGRPQLAISRDGRSLVFVADRQLWLRSLDDATMTPTPIRGTEDGGRAPFLSPDGRHVGFWDADGEIKRVSIDGGTPTPLTAAANPHGAFWSEDGWIYFGQGDEGILRVHEDGGEAEQVVALEPGESSFGPSPLPGGEWILFALRPAGVEVWDDAEIFAQSLETGERVPLHSGGSDPRWVPTGHLVFARDGTLWAIRLDPRRLETVGRTTPVIETLRPADGPLTGASQFAFSDGGTLAYLVGEALSRRALIWVDAEGNTEPIAERAGADDPRLSPDGRRIAVEGVDEDRRERIWIYDTEGLTWSLLTLDGPGVNPLWSPDGEYVYFFSDRDGPAIWRRRTDFSEPARKIWDGAAATRSSHGSQLIGHPTSFHPDGDQLLYANVGPGQGGLPSVGLLDLREPPHAEALLSDPSIVYRLAQFHPTGRWIAYDSDESGIYQVHVREIADDGTLGRRWTISTAGGAEAVWSRDGATLYYREPEAGQDLMAVSVETEPSFTPSRPVVALEGHGGGGGFPEFDVAPDGRFLRTVALEPEGSADADVSSGSSQPERIHVIVNWFGELRARQ